MIIVGTSNAIHIEETRVERPSPAAVGQSRVERPSPAAVGQSRVERPSPAAVGQSRVEQASSPAVGQTSPSDHRATGRRRIKPLSFPLLELDCTSTTLPDEQHFRAMLALGARYIAWHVTIDELHLKRSLLSNEWQLFIKLLTEAVIPSGTPNGRSNPKGPEHILILGYDRTVEYSSRILDAVETLRDALPAVPCLLDTEHPSWKAARVQAVLKSLRLPHIFIDAPQLFGFVKDAEYHVSRIGYLRCVGRNKRTWFEHTPEERFQYSYSAVEIDEIARRARKLEEEHESVFVAFINRPAAEAAQSAREMMGMLQHDKSKTYFLPSLRGASRSEAEREATKQSPN